MKTSLRVLLAFVLFAQMGFAETDPSVWQMIRINGQTKFSAYTGGSTNVTVPLELDYQGYWRNAYVVKMVVSVGSGSIARGCQLATSDNVTTNFTGVIANPRTQYPTRLVSVTANPKFDRSGWMDYTFEVNGGIGAYVSQIVPVFLRTAPAQCIFEVMYQGPIAYASGRE